MNELNMAYVVIAVNAVALVFNAGVVWQKLRGLNGLAQSVKEHSTAIAAIEARCEVRHSAE